MLHFETCGHDRSVCENVFTWTMTVDALAEAPASAGLRTIEPPSSVCSALKRETEVDVKGSTPPPSKCTPNCKFGCFHWETRQTFVDHKSLAFVLTPAQSCPAVELLWAEHQYWTLTVLAWTVKTPTGSCCYSWLYFFFLPFMWQIFLWNRKLWASAFHHAHFVPLRYMLSIFQPGCLIRNEFPFSHSGFWVISTAWAWTWWNSWRSGSQEAEQRIPWALWLICS